MTENKMEMADYEFPDEKASKKEAQSDDDFDLEIEDDTPAADRGREPLPKDIVDELDNDELEEYSDKVKVKMKQMKKVWHDERREKERALREQQEAVTFAQKILQENKALKTRMQDADQNMVSSYKVAAEFELDAAKKEYKDAYDAGDSDRMVDAQEKLANANYKLQKIRDYRPAPVQTQESSVNSEPIEPVVRPDPKANAWQKRNSWFGEDEEMTAAALGLHEKLVKQHGMSYATTDEYYSRVDETMRRRFPESFEGQESTQDKSSRTKPSNVVAPATRSTSSKKIVLKASQQNIAKKLGLTNEQYAREMMRMEANNG